MQSMSSWSMPNQNRHWYEKVLPNKHCLILTLIVVDYFFLLYVLILDLMWHNSFCLYINWWKGKPSGSIACTRKQQPRLYWSCSLVVMNDATPLMPPPSAWAELHQYDVLWAVGLELPNKPVELTIMFKCQFLYIVAGVASSTYRNYVMLYYLQCYTQG